MSVSDFEMETGDQVAYGVPTRGGRWRDGGQWPTHRHRARQLRAKRLSEARARRRARRLRRSGVA